MGWRILSARSGGFPLPGMCGGGEPDRGQTQGCAAKEHLNKPAVGASAGNRVARGEERVPPPCTSANQGSPAVRLLDPWPMLAGRWDTTTKRKAPRCSRVFVKNAIADGPRFDLSGVRPRNWHEGVVTIPRAALRAEVLGECELGFRVCSFNCVISAAGRNTRGCSRRMAIWCDALPQAGRPIGNAREWKMLAGPDIIRSISAAGWACIRSGALARVRMTPCKARKTATRNPARYSENLDATREPSRRVKAAELVAARRRTLATFRTRRRSLQWCAGGRIIRTGSRCDDGTHSGRSRLRFTRLHICARLGISTLCRKAVRALW